MPHTAHGGNGEGVVRMLNVGEGLVVKVGGRRGRASFKMQPENNYVKEVICNAQHILYVLAYKGLHIDFS